MKATYHINPSKVSKFFAAIISVLFVGNLLYIITRFYYGYSYRKLFSLFDFNGEGNIPTFYSVSAIIFVSVLLFVIGFVKNKQHLREYKYWLFLGFLFLVLSYDEAAQLHENLNAVTREYLPENTTSFLYFAWVIPYAAIALTICIFLAKFITNLPKRTAFLFIASGTVFVAGAIGMELIGSYFYTHKNALMYHFSYTAEETLEMLGIVLFIYAILDYVKNFMGEIVSIGFNNYTKLHSNGETKEGNYKIFNNNRLSDEIEREAIIARSLKNKM